MSDKVLRHVIALSATLGMLLVYWVGYVSGVRGWWASGLSILFVYAIVYKLVDA